METCPSQSPGVWRGMWSARAPPCPPPWSAPGPASSSSPVWTIFTVASTLAAQQIQRALSLIPQTWLLMVQLLPQEGTAFHKDLKKKIINWKRMYYICHTSFIYEQAGAELCQAPPSSSHPLAKIFAEPSYCNPLCLSTVLPFPTSESYLPTLYTLAGGGW